MLCTAQRQASTLSSLINLGSRADPLLTAKTTAMLSQWHSIFFPFHHGPHRATATTIGTSSFGEMGIPFHEGGHANWNQWPWQTAPHPQVPDASELHVAEKNVGGMSHTPFQMETKEFHQAISALAPASSET